MPRADHRNSRFTHADLRRAAEAIRASPYDDPDALTTIRAFRNEHVDPMWAVIARLHSLDCAHISIITGRTKNVGTILEKLRMRQTTMRLDRMHDIAGARLILFGDYGEQDRAVAEIVAAFPGTEAPLDRRAQPSFGYRAVHVHVIVEGYRAEIQVRTRGQDRWAQIMERLGDVWGRQIKYGEPPNPASEPMNIRGALVPPSEVIDYLRQVSEQLHGVEQAQHRLLSRFGGSTEELMQTLLKLRRDVDGLFEDLKEVPATWGTDSCVIGPSPAVSPGEQTQLFLVVYQRSKAQLRTVDSFNKRELAEAVQQQAQAEAEAQGDPDFEIVLLESENLDTLRRTHSRYFKSLDELAAGDEG